MGTILGQGGTPSRTGARWLSLSRPSSTRGRRRPRLDSARTRFLAVVGGCLGWACCAPGRAEFGDPVIAFCRAGPVGCSCSYEGVETPLDPAEHLAMLR